MKYTFYLSKRNYGKIIEIAEQLKKSSMYDILRFDIHYNPINNSYNARLWLGVKETLSVKRKFIIFEDGKITDMTSSIG